MIIDVSSCMYVRRVRAHVIHVTRDSVNGKVRRMMLEGVPDAVRERKKGKGRKEREREKCKGGKWRSARNHFSRILYLVAYNFYLYNCAY